MFSRRAIYDRVKKKYPYFAKWIKHVPASQYWYFVMDGRDFEYGPEYYDIKEPGYMQAMLSSFKFVLEEVSHQPKITFDFIADLQKLATIGVENLNNENQGIRTNGSGRFSLISDEDYEPDSNCTIAGFNELAHEWVQIRGHVSFRYLGHNAKFHTHEAALQLRQGRGVDLHFKCFSEKKLRKYVNIAIDHYYQNINLAQTDFEKIYSIARFLHHLNLIHSFCDANIRTYVFLLGSLLLIQNGFFPIEYENPNVFDAYSSYELCLLMMMNIKRTAKEYNLNIDLKGFLEPFKTHYDPYAYKKKIGPKVLFHYKNPFRPPTSLGNTRQAKKAGLIGRKRSRESVA